jgi:hypothetical protein
MAEDPKLLVWGYTREEVLTLNSFLQEMGAPPAILINPEQGRLTLRQIIHGELSGEPLQLEERVILFDNVPNRGVQFLISALKAVPLHSPIYAVVTEHSIEWPFHELVQHLVKEREAWKAKEAAKVNEAKQ